MPSSYDLAWVAEKMATINEIDVDQDTRTALRDAVLDGMNALDLAEHYRTEGCPLCGSHNVLEHMHMVLCNGCRKRVA